MHRRPLLGTRAAGPAEEEATVLHHTLHARGRIADMIWFPGSGDLCPARAWQDFMTPRGACPGCRPSMRGYGPDLNSPAPTIMPLHPLDPPDKCFPHVTTHAERCRSGRSGRSRKPLTLQGVRGFESHPLRHTIPISHWFF